MRSMLIKWFVLLVVPFSVYVSGKEFFRDDFTGDELTWTASEAKKDFGKFKFIKGEGVKTSEDARFYALGKKLAEPFSNKDLDLIIQYSVRHPQNIDCGGGYVKLFEDSFDPVSLDGSTPYLLMFGPDICGSTKKVHAIFSYNGKEVHKKSEVRCEDDTYTHTYTLKINKDNTYEMEIDGESKAKGSLEDDFPFLADKRIKDPKAKKPTDWVDSETIDDPEDKKPDDWDQPETIPDPEDKKPEDWDDESDGDWEPKKIDNPEFKGKWKPKQIPNPDYKGPWKHPMIDNPDYKPDSNLYAFKKNLGGIGFDLWQVKSGTIFGHVLITDDEDLAQKQVEVVNDIREKEKQKQKEEEEENRKKMDDTENSTSDDSNDDPEDDDDDEENDEDAIDRKSNDENQLPPPIVEDDSHDEL